MRKRRVSVAVWVAAGLVAAGTAGGPLPAAGQSASAKGIYEEGNEVGVKFQVLRERGGELRRVSSSYPFGLAIGSSSRSRRIARRSSTC